MFLYVFKKSRSVSQNPPKCSTWVLSDRRDRGSGTVGSKLHLLRFTKTDTEPVGWTKPLSFIWLPVPLSTVHVSSILFVSCLHSLSFAHTGPYTVSASLLFHRPSNGTEPILFLYIVGSSIVSVINAEVWSSNKQVTCTITVYVIVLTLFSFFHPVQVNK